jgi:hypothetical protein
MTEAIPWVPAACALLTAERPVRRAEFDDLFATGVRSVDRVERLRVRLELDPDPAMTARAASLVVRETECCSFFVFTLRIGGGRVLLDVEVPAGYVEVLDGLADRAAAGRRP